MKPDKKYFISQLIAIPAVGLPSVLGGLLLGGKLASLAGASGPVESGPLVLVSCILLVKATSALAGIALEKIGMLPRFSWRYYPNATSWGGYLKKTGAFQGIHS